MSLSRKRKKELRRLQKDANQLWESQQVLVGQAGDIAREAGRQLGQFNREQVIPTVQKTYEQRVAPVILRGREFSQHLVDDKIVPTVGGVIGSALATWDHASAKRRGVALPVIAVPEQKRGSAGKVIAIVLGSLAAVAVVVAAWRTLRTDDELWVSDDSLGGSES